MIEKERKHAKSDRKSLTVLTNSNRTTGYFEEMDRT